MKEIQLKDLRVLEGKYQNKPVQSALRRVLSKNDLTQLFDVTERKPDVQFKFSHEIKTLPVTYQKQSGRCWIYAGLNLMREDIAKRYELKSFELSQNYVAFYDKLEKINYFLEIMNDFLDVDSDDRTLQHILKTGIQDGGQWDMFVSLVEKYGVVPKEAMVETQSSGNTRFMNQLINIKLRQYAASVRKLASEEKIEDIPLLKAKTLEELYTFLTTNFGVPPKTFDFEFMFKEQLTRDVQMTPLTFYKKYFGNQLTEYVSIINAPTKDKPFMKTYTVQYLGNVIGGRDIKYLNVEMKDLKQLVLKQLLNHELVWFGSDVARFGDRILGIWDDQSYDIDTMLEMDFSMTKAEQLDYSQSAMNHAMVITAVNLNIDQKPNRWKIQNSWGDQHGEKGYYLASNSWFDQFVYQAVIHKKHLSKQQLEAWTKEPVELKPWDPMGSLAKS